MRQRDALIAGAALAALLLYSRRASAAINPGADIRFTEGMYPAPVGWDEGPELPDAGIDTPTDWDLTQLGVGLPEFFPSEDADMPNSIDPQVAAFLYAIRCSEHNAADVASGRDYQTFYSGLRFVDMTDHPVITGELKGVKLPDAMCKAAGYGPGCVSTAAGAYQITRPTWVEFRELSPRLPDFSPASQDAAAARILERLGVRRLLYAGDVQGAIMKASTRWASLPGSTAKQGGRTMAFVLDKFSQAGGTYA